MMPTLQLTDIQIRDPFIVPVAEEGRYYLYGTTDLNCWAGKATGFNGYASADLVNWDGPFPAFRPAEDFWATENFWAPEVHRYNGRYFMFASFKAPLRERGTQVLVANDPHGQFLPHSDGPVTPHDWGCLDGTLYVDAHGDPWMVFCHEWVQVGDGEMCAMRLSADLSCAASEPILLFRASEAPWVRPIDNAGNYVTDGPFLHRARNGELLLLWSSFGEGGYAIGVARSRSGEITGSYTHDPAPLYGKDGGHGMLFRTFAGELYLTIHTPNVTPNERPILLPLREDDSTLLMG